MKIACLQTVFHITILLHIFPFLNFLFRFVKIEPEKGILRFLLQMQAFLPHIALPNGYCIYVAHLASCLLTVLLCLIPHIFSWKLNYPIVASIDSFPILKALNSKEYLISLVSSTSMSVHMIVSIVGHSLLSKGYLYSYRNFYSKALLIITLLTPDLMQLFVVIPNSDFSMYVLFRYLRYFTFATITLLYLATCGGSIWKSMAPLNGLLVAYSGFIVKYYIYYLDDNESVGLLPLSLCLQGVGTALLALCTYRWCQQLYRNNAIGKKLTSDQYCCNVYLVAFWTVGIGLWVLATYNRFPDWYEVNTYQVVGENCLYTVYYILITVFEGHAVLMEAITSQVFRIPQLCFFL